MADGPLSNTAASNPSGIGKPVSRTDGPIKVCGRAPYAAEYEVPNLLHAVVVGSTITRGKILSIDTAAARALPGVVGRTPILALTANTLPEQLTQYEQAGMDDCIAKPMNIVDLVMRVTAWGASDWRTFDPRLEDAAAAVV